MATPLPEAPQGAEAEGAEEAEERTRLPRVVVRMSDAMFAALKTYCETNSVLPTTLGRTLLAQEIGWDLSKDPDAPGSATRTRYSSDTERQDAKDKNRTYNRLLRKALYQVHMGTLHKRPALVTKAQATVAALADKAKVTSAQLTTLSTELDEAIKAGV
jgi:hypothetical protein